MSCTFYLLRMFTGHVHALHPFGHSTAAQVYTDQVELLSLQLTCDTTDVAQSPTISTDNDDMKFVVGAGKDVVAVRAILRPFPGALATRRGSVPVTALRRVHMASCLYRANTSPAPRRELPAVQARGCEPADFDHVRTRIAVLRRSATSAPSVSASSTSPTASGPWRPASAASKT